MLVLKAWWVELGCFRQKVLSPTVVLTLPCPGCPSVRDGQMDTLASDDSPALALGSYAQ